MSRYSLDSIYLRNLQLSASVGFDAWGRTGKHQPLALSLRLYRDTSLAGGSDTIQDTLSYGQMCKDLTAKIDGHEFGSLDTLTGAIESLSNAWSGRKLSYTVTLPKGLLRADGGFGREIVLQRNSSGTWQFLSGLWFIKQIKTACIIGVNPHERLEKQGVSIDIYVPGNQLDLDKELCTSQSDQTWRNLVRMATDVVERSSFETLEALATLVSRTILYEFTFPEVTVSVEKPSALVFVEASGVEITRSREDFEA